MLDGKLAVVTGAARGIGRVFALRLARLGADVAICDADLEGAARFGETLSAPSVVDEIRQLGVRGLACQADLTDRGAVDAVVRETLDTFGRIDILVNNAGGAITPMERSWAAGMPDEDTERIFAVNLMTTIHMSQAVAVVMRRQKSGVIVNVSSMAGLNAAVRDGALAHYGMAKTAVIQYTRFLAAELGPDGIAVNSIAPGTIATARIRSLAQARNIGAASDIERIPLRRLGTEEDCAGVLEFLVSDLSAYVTGQCISVCGGRVLTPS